MGHKCRLECLSPAAYYAKSANLAPVAQLDRALPSEGRGREFESRRVRHARIMGALFFNKSGFVKH